MAFALLTLDLNDDTPEDARESVYAALAKLGMKKLPTTTTWTWETARFDERQIEQVALANLKVVIDKAGIADWEAIVVGTDSPPVRFP